MSQPSFVLRITRANQPAAESEFTKDRLTIGRDVGDLAMNDPGCSSKHAEITFLKGKCGYATSAARTARGSAHARSPTK